MSMDWADNNCIGQAKTKFHTTTVGLWWQFSLMIQFRVFEALKAQRICDNRLCHIESNTQDNRNTDCS